MKKTGFVAPWYGEKIGGGAEAELRGLIHHLADAGVPLEVLTTCAESFASDWSLDYHEPGLTVEAGIPVRRFRTRRRNEELFERVNRKLVNGRSVSIAEESIYCREMTGMNTACLFLFPICSEQPITAARSIRKSPS